MPLPTNVILDSAAEVVSAFIDEEKAGVEITDLGFSHEEIAKAIQHLDLEGTLISIKRDNRVYLIKLD